MGFLSSVGGVLNDITGASSSAAQAQKYSKRLMKIQNGYNKEMMQNAHQWEVEDLQKAGLNPILSAGGSGATPVGGGLGGGATGQAGTNPIELFDGIVSAKKTLSEEENIKADTALKTAQTAATMNDTGNGWFGKILGQDAGEEAIKIINAPINHVKNKWNSAKIVKQKKGQSGEDYKKAVLKNILLGE